MRLAGDTTGVLHPRSVREQDSGVVGLRDELAAVGPSQQQAGGISSPPSGSFCGVFSEG